MTLTLRELLGLSAAGILLALSMLSVYYSYRTRSPYAGEASHLFNALGRGQSLASNTGAVFSVTYFFGATFIYGAVFRSWVAVVGLLIFLIAGPLMFAITRRLHAANLLTSPDAGNPLLALLKQGIARPEDFQDIVRLYSLIYFGLLVEELAVSRLVLYTLLGNAGVVALFLILLTFVVSRYLHLGGFRAVLAADTVQMTVLVIFMIALLIVTVSGSVHPGRLLSDFAPQTLLNGFNLAGAVLFGTAWFLAAIDFYARLRFETHNKTAATYRGFVVASLVSICVVLMVGAFFGAFLSAQLTLRSPSSYALEAVAFFMSQHAIVSCIFVAAVFAMIFTTIDTLLLIVLQVGFHQEPPRFRRSTLSTIVLIAIILSTQMDFDSVSAIGIFIGSLLLLPALALCRAVWPAAFRWLPEQPRYLLWATFLAIAGFAFVYHLILVRFDRLFLLSFLTGTSALICALITVSAGLVRRANVRD